MDPLVYIIGITLVPVIVLTLLRASAATAFLALCLGSTFSNYVADDTVSMLRGFLAQTPELNDMVISLLFLWLPVVVIAIFMLNTIGKKQLVINLLPALAVGLFGMLLSVPYLTPELRIIIEPSNVYQQIVSYQSLIVALGAVVSVVLLRMRKKVGDKHSKHH